MRTFTIPDAVTLPPLAANMQPQPFTFCQFVVQYIARAKELRSDQALPFLFRLSDWLNAQADWSPGATMTMADDLWGACKAAARDEIEHAVTEPAEAPRLSVAWMFPVMRLYQVFATAAQVSDAEAKA